MERKQSPSSSSSPCQRSHSFFDDLRSPPLCNSSHSQVNLGKPFYRQRFQKAVKSTPREGPGSADHSAPNIASKGAPKNSSTKALLYELCAAYRWKPPLFDCLKEDGPSHLRRFILKVVVETKAGNETTVIEAFSEPKPTKKSAAEDAAEGALWYLKHLGYFPKKK